MMKGRITEYRPAESRGTITAFNAERYGFGAADWRSPGEPQTGLDVEFQIDGRSAREIALRAPAVFSSATVPTLMDPDMGFFDAVNICFEKFVTFEGRARRKEFWYFALFTVLAQFILLTVQAAVSGGLATTSGPLSTLLTVALILPWMAVLTRRFHDTDLPGYCTVALYLVPVGFLMGFPLAARIIPIALRLVIYKAAASIDIVMILALIAMLVLAARAGTPGSNRYGPDPLSPPEENF